MVGRYLNICYTAYVPKNWNKGLTKETNLSVKKISETMKLKKINNFKSWHEKMKLQGKIKSIYPPLKENGDLAELIGVTLGDGHICTYPRTEEVRIISNSNNPGFIKRYARILEKVFSKRPYVIPSSKHNCTKIGLYEKFISKRLKIASGARRDLNITIPKWILTNEKFIIRYLRGLYEAEGSLSFHEKTYTHKFIFTNRNQSLLDIVYKLVKKLGFTPHVSLYKVQISKKDEVSRLVKLLRFRKY